jgi:hypothetical protein
VIPQRTPCLPLSILRGGFNHGDTETAQSFAVLREAPPEGGSLPSAYFLLPTVPAASVAHCYQRIKYSFSI